MTERQARKKRDDEQFCSEWGGVVSKQAVVCVHCGVPLRLPPRVGAFGAEAAVAIVLSVFFPGAGQMIYGRVGLRLVFLLLTVLSLGLLWIVFMPISLALTIGHYSRRSRESV